MDYSLGHDPPLHKPTNEPRWKLLGGAKKEQAPGNCSDTWVKAVSTCKTKKFIFNQVSCFHTVNTTMFKFVRKWGFPFLLLYKRTFHCLCSQMISRIGPETQIIIWERWEKVSQICVCLCSLFCLVSGWTQAHVALAFVWPADVAVFAGVCVCVCYPQDVHTQCVCSPKKRACLENSAHKQPRSLSSFPTWHSFLCCSSRVVWR